MSEEKRKSIDDIAELVTDTLLDKWKLIQERMRLTKDYRTTKDYFYQTGYMKALQDMLQYIMFVEPRDKRSGDYHVPE